MASVHDAAGAIIERLGTVDNMKLQKLLFFAQGWSLAWRGVPMFDDNLEAWKKGPVVDSVYQTYKRHKWYPISEPVRGDPSKLSDDERHMLTAVLDCYVRLNGRELSDITHDNPAWATSWSRRPHPKRSR